MRTPSRNRRASHVQPSGRPSGAPYELDVAQSFCDSTSGRKKSLQKTRSQTPEYNLNSAIRGPTIGVHFTPPEEQSANHHWQSLRWQMQLTCL